MFSRNVGTVDRWLRVVLGIVLLATIALIDGPAQWIGLIGIIPLVTGLAGTCPLYRVFGLSTCPVSRAS